MVNILAIKKSKKPFRQSQYFNYKGYKGYFSLVLLALVDAEYKFLWVNVGSSGSSSDAQIFYCSKLKRKIENGTLGLQPPEQLGPGGPDLHYFRLGDDAFVFMPCLVKPYSRRQLTRENRTLENAFGILVSRFMVLLMTMEQRPRVETLC